MSGPIELTDEQRIFDFEVANPGMRGSVIYQPSSHVPFYPPPRQEYKPMASITIYEADTVVRFGKYKGKDYKIKGLMTLDPEYLIWMHENVEWFALTEKLYRDACTLADTFVKEKYAEKATQSLEQPSGWDDDEEQEEDLVDKLSRDTGRPPF